MKKMMITLFVGLLFLTGCQERAEKDIAIIDGDIAEMNVATQMAKILIEEYTDYTVYVQPSMAYNLAFDQIKNKNMDLSLSWDGTVLSTFLKQDPRSVPKDTTLYDYTNILAQEQAHVKLLDKFGAQNSYVVAVSGEVARQHNLSKISDLIPIAPQLVFAAEHSFFDEMGSVRYRPLTEFYGLEFKEYKSIDIGLKFAGLESKNMDVTLVTSADGMIEKYDVVMLEDDLSFFPEYHTAFMVRDDLEKDYPGVEEVLNKLGGMISTDDSRKMNYEVDVNVKNPAKVAEEFLKSKNLIK